MSNRLFSNEQLHQVITELNIPSLEQATIGEVVLIASRLVTLTGTPFIRMDQGVPGLPPSQVGIEAEKCALDSGIAAIYPAAAGVPVLKEEASRFVKAFLDTTISPAACVPVTGSVAGSFGSFIIASQCDPTKDTILFIDPGFPIQKSQLKVLGIPYLEFDVYEHRGEKLVQKLTSYLSKGNIAAIVYSNPNNPAWICLTANELQLIGQLATQYDAIVIEDLAYFGMDFRSDYGEPFKPPFVPTVASYTDNYLLMISSSKIFSYAGQRVAVVCVSDTLFARTYPALAARYAGSGLFGSTLVASILYMITSGVCHSAQFGFAAMLKAAADGSLNFVQEISVYGQRAAQMKALFVANGFHIVYDKDLETPLADGFFFTIGYQTMTCGELMRELLQYGISSIALSTTGSEQQGVRACCSRMNDEAHYTLLEQRLHLFNLDHP